MTHQLSYKTYMQNDAFSARYILDFRISRSDKLSSFIWRSYQNMDQVASILQEPF